MAAHGDRPPQGLSWVLAQGTAIPREGNATWVTVLPGSPLLPSGLGLLTWPRAPHLALPPLTWPSPLLTCSPPPSPGLEHFLDLLLQLHPPLPLPVQLLPQHLRVGFLSQLPELLLCEGREAQVSVTWSILPPMRRCRERAGLQST